jgi:predicted ATPase/DNA-binding SARP family transcriptional activator
MAHLSIDVLGSFQVSIDHAQIMTLESVKVNALLAYLAVESDRQHRRETLVGLFWPDYPEEAARHNLRQALFNLRVGIGDHTANPPYLFISRDSIQFNQKSDYSLDIDQFNRGFNTHLKGLTQNNEDNPANVSDLEEIIKLYRGEFLQQFFLEDSTEFEEWALAQRESLHQRALELHSFLTNYYEQHSDFKAARRHALRQLELDPWREEAHRQMMRVLAMEGERSAALAQYDACERVLAEELDVEPSIETRELYDQIRLEIIKPRIDQPIHIPVAPVKRLPLQLTPFIGRETELGHLSQLISNPECRCITLVGPGGIGKTRLALKAAEGHINEFAQGAVFIPLASIGSPVGIIPAILNTININYYGPGEPKTHLLSYLSDKEMLLILDNVEHLLAGGFNQENIAQLSIEILQSAPGIKLLVTSRETLNTQGEWLFEVPGLAFPEASETEGLEEYDAIALFIQRARHVSTRFIVNEENRAEIAHICRLVEGMPLAIELAATWMRALSPVEIAAEIEKDIDFLSATVQDLPERHRNMRVVFDYSWQMLSKEEQQVLSKLSVFRGGFEREAAEKVAEATLSILSTLVNRTLVRRTAAGRYDLHELVRQYSAAQLATDPQAKAMAHRQHFAFYLALAETAEQELKGRNQLEWLGRLEQNHDNLRAALEWALKNDRTPKGNDELALRLSAALRWFWRMRGHFHEGCNWLMEALRQSPEIHTAARASALLGMSLLINALGDLGGARAPAEESTAIYRELGNHQCLAEALIVEGLALLWQGDATLSHARTREALTIYRSVGDQWGEAHALYRLGSYLADYGGDPLGRSLLEESAAILENLGDRYLYTSVLISLGIVDMSHGDYAAARSRFESGLAATKEIRHPWGIADALTNLGCLYQIQGDYETAQARFEEALQVYHEHGRNIWETDVLCAMAENAIAQGDLSTARFHLQAASNLLGSSKNKWLQVVVWYFTGLLAYYEGNLEEAAALLDQTIVHAREGQFKPDLARSLVTFGRVRLSQGKVAISIQLLREGLGLFKEIGHKFGIAKTLEVSATISAVYGDSAEAVRLFATAHTLREVMNAPIPPIDRAANDSTIATLKSRLGEALFNDLWKRAADIPVEEVAEEILMVDSRNYGNQDHYKTN